MNNLVIMIERSLTLHLKVPMIINHSFLIHFSCFNIFKQRDCLRLFITRLSTQEKVLIDEKS
jgi:hypothetical protein